MKPITFENLRRLMGGGRKKKDRAESSFKRSDSFRRISIKRNYLDRGGKGKHHQQSKVVVTPSESNSTKQPLVVNSAVLDDGPESLVIGYNQWIRGMKAENGSGDSSTSNSKSCGRTLSSQDGRPPTPPPRKKNSVCTDSSSVEILRFERSPIFTRRRFRPSPPPSSLVLDPKGEDGGGSSRTDSALSVSLGRIWMDAPLAMAPRSLELPRLPSPSCSGSADVGPNGRRAHHSLDSALKERRDDHMLCNRRFHNYPTRPMSPTPFIVPNTSLISRTLSSSTQTNSTSKTMSSRESVDPIFSSKDSGFSFSISIPKLTDFTTSVAGGGGGGGGFFRKKKTAKPKPSVSRDGYFKRTSGAAKATEAKRGSVRRSSSRKKKGGGRSSGRNRKKSQGGTARSEMYQVVISRPPRSLKSLKLDPMIFVPPEKRKPIASMKKLQHRKYEVKEIRDYCSPRDTAFVPSFNNYEEDEEDEGLYECISGDFNERVEVQPTLDLDDRFTEEELAIALPPDSDSETENETYVPLGVSPVPRRRPVRRKKSTRKSVKYLAKPSIHRAPSTLRRSRKLTKKTSCEY
ncbi:hypothetical protein C0J52_28184 [Blattella germanica]|nr:hypothetical protein C0J52_28184 [Blattella germanica]